MHRKLKFHFIIIMLAFLVLTGCSSSTANADALEGYWMDESGSTVTFTGDGSVIWYGRSLSYTIYDKNKVLIKDGEAEVGNYKFTIQSDVLELSDPRSASSYILYGNESTQQKILDDIQSAENAIIEKSMREAEQRLEQGLLVEWSAEIEMLKTYQAFCRKQIHNNIDVNLYTSELNYTQDRLDILNSKKRSNIDADSFSMAKLMLQNYILPEDISTSDTTIYFDSGYDFLDVEETIIGYIIEVRTQGEGVSPIYGYYAVQFSTNTIYTIEFESDFWYPLYHVALLNE